MDSSTLMYLFFVFEEQHSSQMFLWTLSSKKKASIYLSSKNKVLTRTSSLTKIIIPPPVWFQSNLKSNAWLGIINWFQK